jgi:hypothetical protein
LARLRNHFPVETPKHSMCIVVVVVVDQHVIANNQNVIANNIKILNVAQQCFYGQFITDDNAKYTYEFF